MFHIILSLTVFIVHLTNADIYDEYECFLPLMQRAVVTATSSMRDREPKNAILYGGNAWTAHTSDFEQKLVFDLGQVMNITRIWTQGRTHSNEYVMEFSVSYGSNGFDYTDYKEPGGDVRVRIFLNVN
uniref:F5/8 type C domain-containing protein n=1 Tax=Photinus pyralis TaxID=7054 RepID=A0A1Y1LGW4_PHOPY